MYHSKFISHCVDDGAQMLFRLQLKTREINKLAEKEVLVGCVWM